MTCEQHHTKRHAEITARLTTLVDPPAPVPAWTADFHRRHAVQQTAWALSDHLRCCHGVRRHGQQTPGAIGRLVEIHAALHKASRVS